VNGSVFSCVDGTSLIDWLSNDIDNSTESFWTDWHENGSTGIGDTLTSNETFSGIQGDGSHVVASQMLSDFQDQSVLSTFYFEGIQNGWQLAIEVHINDGTNNL
jgi:hypothetical protein